MNKAFLFLFFCIVANTSIAQDIYWKVTLNRKTVLKATDDTDTVANKILISKADLSNNNIFKIEYFNKAEKSPKGSWFRTMSLFDASENPTVRLDSANVLMVANRDLLKLLWVRRKVTAYTWSAPSDLSMAAAIRIRRVRMFTIELID